MHTGLGFLCLPGNFLFYHKIKTLFISHNAFILNYNFLVPAWLHQFSFNVFFPGNSISILHFQICSVNVSSCNQHIFVFLNPVSLINSVITGFLKIQSECLLSLICLHIF